MPAYPTFMLSTTPVTEIVKVNYFHTVFNKIGLCKMVSRCALAVEWMSIAWLDLICPYNVNTYYLGLGTFLKAMMSSHCRTTLH